jgi:hypothetical protein
LPKPLFFVSFPFWRWWQKKQSTVIKIIQKKICTRTLKPRAQSTVRVISS